ncbi:MAG: GAF domain-containing protein, partial [Calditrichaeota bacterium]|nr:GAF domain-containing protein [Calditrichota bacterium]
MNISEQYLQALVDISREINSIQSQQPLLEKILEIAIHQLSAERGFVLLKDAETGELQSRAAHIPPGESQQPDEMISQTALNSVIEKQQPILTFDTLSDAQFDDSQSVVAHKIRSIACVPLLQKGKLIGAIYIDSRGQIASFTRQSLDFLNAFANQAAIAIENAQFVDALRRENDRLQQEVQQKYTFKELVGESPAMEELFHLMTRVLNKDTTVLITGETGTGKEVVARAIHFNGT